MAQNLYNHLNMWGKKYESDDLTLSFLKKSTINILLNNHE